MFVWNCRSPVELMCLWFQHLRQFRSFSPQCSSPRLGRAAGCRTFWNMWLQSCRSSYRLGERLRIRSTEDQTWRAAKHKSSKMRRAAAPTSVLVRVAASICGYFSFSAPQLQTCLLKSVKTLLLSQTFNSDVFRCKVSPCLKILLLIWTAALNLRNILQLKHKWNQIEMMN